MRGGRVQGAGSGAQPRRLRRRKQAPPALFRLCRNGLRPRPPPPHIGAENEILGKRAKKEGIMKIQYESVCDFA